MEQSMSWMLPVFALLIGIVIGLIIGRLMPASTPSNSREKLDEMQDRLQQYQGEVVDHFAATAGLVQRMNESYKDVLDHLADGAGKLSPDDETRERLMATLSEPVSSTPRITRTSSPDEQPRDYAPGHGTLSESFSAQHAPAKEQEEPVKPVARTEKPAEAAKPAEEPQAPAEAAPAEEPATETVADTASNAESGEDKAKA